MRTVFLQRGKFLVEAGWNLELVQILLGTHGVLSVFLRDGKFLVEAGGILSLCNFSQKSDWTVFVTHA